MNTSWTQDQVEQLNRLQRGELFGHPYTCPNRSIMPHHYNGHDTGCLVATKNGWWCPDCGYTQDWFHESSLLSLTEADIFARISHAEVIQP